MQKISAQVPEYNYNSLILSDRFPQWACIEGEQDPFFIEKNLLKSQTIIIPRVGHYPFFENPAEFSRTIKQIMSRMD
jgi:pimeloyl-ACP methyl ester carboxylesterase